MGECGKTFDRPKQTPSGLSVLVGGIATITFIIAALAAIVGALWVVPAYFEAKTFNRLTGAHATTWDAMWVELRVQGNGE